MDEGEFEEMAKHVVETNSMFTGAEAGKSFHRRLTTKQLDALIKHFHELTKKNSTEKTEQMVMDPLEAVIKNIKMEVEEEKKTKLGAKKNSKFIDHGLENSGNARLNKLLKMGRKLRTEGVSPRSKLMTPKKLCNCFHDSSWSNFSYS